MRPINKILILGCLFVLCTSMLAVTVIAKDTTKISPVSYGIDNLNNDPGELYVAYIGGSITEGVGGTSVITYKDNAGSGPARWSSQLTKRYFQKKYPAKNVVEVNAGLSGTPSDLGLFRLRKDVVEPCGVAGPDVVFVEFAVNDAARDAVKVSRAMEGIVRQLAHLPKQPVVIFVLSAAWRESYDGFGKYLESAALHKQIADYYGIASINMCEYVKSGVDIEGNEIIWDKEQKTHVNAWTWDNIHPCPKGHTGYTDYLIHCFNKEPEKYFKKLDWKEIPMSGYEFGNPDVVGYDDIDATFTGNWIESSEILSGTFKKVYITEDDGATITLKFNGRSFGMFVARGEEGAVASCVIDGGASKRINNYYDGSWMATGDFIITDLAPGEHTLVITTKHESGKGKKFAFGYFLLDEQTPDPVLTDVMVKSEDKEISQVKVGNKLSVDYVFVNGNVEEGETTYQWLISNKKDGPYTEISGAIKNTYTPDTTMIDKYVKARINAQNTAGIGKFYETNTVHILRPSASECFLATEHTYFISDEMISHLETGNITAKASVTNILEVAHPISMITAEYEILENGIEKLVNLSCDTKIIESGKTADFENTIQVMDINHILKTFILSRDNLEPIGDISNLSKNRFVCIETILDSNEIAVSVYEVKK